MSASATQGGHNYLYVCILPQRMNEDWYIDPWPATFSTAMTRIGGVSYLGASNVTVMHP